MNDQTPTFPAPLGAPTPPRWVKPVHDIPRNPDEIDGWCWEPVLQRWERCLAWSGHWFGLVQEQTFDGQLLCTHMPIMSIDAADDLDVAAVTDVLVDLARAYKRMLVLASRSNRPPADHEALCVLRDTVTRVTRQQAS